MENNYSSTNEVTVSLSLKRDGFSVGVNLNARNLAKSSFHFLVILPF
jgi:hypothetical protein